MAKRYTLGEEARKDFERLRKAPIKVPGGRLGRRLDSEAGFVWFRIVASSFTIIENRYNYSGIRQIFRFGGVGPEMVDDPDNPDEVMTLFNTCEIYNGPTGIQGNSVDVDTLPPGFALKPVRGNAVVMCTPFSHNGDIYYAFQYENAVDGECQTP